MAFTRLRYLVFFSLGVYAAIAGAMYQTMNMAWVCMVYGETTANLSTPSAYGLLHWGATEQQIVFAGGGLGELLSAIPAGWIVKNYGARKCGAAALFLGAITTLLIPRATTVGALAVGVLRVGAGMCITVFVPLAYATGSWWTPVNEMGLGLACSVCGLQIGLIVQTMIGGQECEIFGWEWIFRINAAASLILAALWIAFFRDSPEEAGIIDEKELKHIAETRVPRITNLEGLPWARIAKSPTLWACMACAFCQSSVCRGFIQFVPTYVRDTMSLHAAHNGQLSWLPTFALFLGAITGGPISDIQCASVIARIKFFNGVSFIGSGCFAVALTFVGHPWPKWLIIATLCGFTFLANVSNAGFMKLSLFICPNYAPVIGSMINVSFGIGNLVVPIYIGAIVRHGRCAEWSFVFTGFSIMMVLAAVMFQLLADDTPLEQGVSAGTRPNYGTLQNEKDMKEPEKEAKK